MQVVELCSEQFNLVFPSCQIVERRDDKFVNSVSSRTSLLTFVNIYVLEYAVSIFQFASRM